MYIYIYSFRLRLNTNKIISIFIVVYFIKLFIAIGEVFVSLTYT